MSQEKILLFFADFIKKELGIIYNDRNFYQLEKRLIEICKNLNIESMQKLYELAITSGINGHFKQLLLDVATNNETSFFRDTKVFEAIKDQLLPEWHKNNPNSSLFRVWSVASSFGQEPYSLAILLNEYREKNPSFPRFDIRATDISERALERAKSGTYSQLEVQRGMPAVKLVKYFKKNDEDMWQIHHDIRSSVIFSKMNILEISGIVGSFDFILCRNVLIYQNDENKKLILKNLHRYLSPEGYLLLGAAESLLGLSNDFDQTRFGSAMFYKRKLLEHKKVGS